MDGKRIMFAGVSGIGKTTLAKYISEKHGIPFVSGSYTDLISNAKGFSHKEILEREPGIKRTEDFQLLTLRSQMVQKYPKLVSDRSFLDSAVYFAYKQAGHLPTCDIEDFIDLCFTQLSKHVTHLIYIPYSINNYDDWKFEDNNRRITNKWFQLQLGSIFDNVLQYGTRGERLSNSQVEQRKTKILILWPLDLEERKKTIDEFLKHYS